MIESLEIFKILYLKIIFNYGLNIHYNIYIIKNIISHAKNYMKYLQIFLITESF